MSLETEIVTALERKHGAGCVASVSGDLAGPATQVTLNDGTIYRIRRLTPRGDWVGRATSDERMRAYQLASGGIFRSLPAGVRTPVVGAVALPTGAALIELDVPDLSLGTPEEIERVMVGLARLHSAFSGFPARLTSGLGLSPLGAWLTLFAPATIERTVDAPREIAHAWRAFAEHAPDVWATVEPLLANPSLIVDGLRSCPATILHGNVIPENVLVADDQVILRDWSQAVRGPGALDLGVFLIRIASNVPVDLEISIERYRAERARLDRLPSSGDAWDRELKRGLLAGVMRYGWSAHDGSTVEMMRTFLR